MLLHFGTYNSFVGCYGECMMGWRTVTIKLVGYYNEFMMGNYNTYGNYNTFKIAFANSQDLVYPITDTR